MSSSSLFTPDTSQTSGTPWNAFIGCTESGVTGTRCQITDQPHWKQDDCVTIAYFNPSYMSVNENGYSPLGTTARVCLSSKKQEIALIPMRFRMAITE